jgi:hypothetical protein
MIPLTLTFFGLMLIGLLINYFGKPRSEASNLYYSIILDINDGIEFAKIREKLINRYGMTEMEADTMIYAVGEPDGEEFVREFLFERKQKQAKK